MKKIILVGCCLFFSLFFSYTYAGGGMTHMFIAQETIALIPDAQLRNLLLDNFEAYVVGAYYPDSGFVAGNTYGEDSHWDPFIFTFTDYIKEKYKDPIAENPKLVAFLFGCAVHRVSDEVIHWVFYDVMSKKEFNGDYKMAHTYGDTGIDLLVNIDKNQWLTHPATWWVPVRDLVEVYHRMGKDEYTAAQIIWGNSALAMAGYGERLISAPAYPYLKWKMPWTAAHYYDWPQGGIVADEHQVADYHMKLWQRLKNRSNNLPLPSATRANSHYDEDTAHLPAIDFAKAALESGAVSIDVKSNADGSVDIQPPVIREATTFQALLRQFIDKLYS